MDRVIKFRAWDKNEQRWRYSTDSDHVSYFWQFVETYLDHETHKTLTQFTGLLDKNGKEIYEGDILRTDPKELYYIKQCLPFIELVDARDWSYDNGDYYQGDNIQCHNWHRFEIIGNVFEHPHLLTAQQ